MKAVGSRLLRFTTQQSTPSPTVGAALRRSHRLLSGRIRLAAAHNYPTNATATATLALTNTRQPFSTTTVVTTSEPVPLPNTKPPAKKSKWGKKSPEAKRRRNRKRNERRRERRKQAKQRAKEAQEKEAQEMQAALTEPPPPPPKKTPAKTKLTADALLYRDSPMRTLSALYRQENLFTSCSAKMKVIHCGLPPDAPRKKPPKAYWTAVLDCPLLQRPVYTGRLRSNDDAYMVLSNAAVVVDNDDDENLPTQVVAYPKQLMARQAVAARALDLWRAQDLQQVEPRLCHDDVVLPPDAAAAAVFEAILAPDAVASTHSTRDKDDDPVKAPRQKGSKVLKGPFHEDFAPEEEEDSEEDDEDQTDPDESIEEEEQDEEDEEEEDEKQTAARLAAGSHSQTLKDEFVVYKPPAKSARTTPAMCLLKSISDRAATSGLSNDTRSVRTAPPTDILVESPNHRAKRTLTWARNWLEKERRKRSKGDKDIPGRIVVQSTSEGNLLSQAKSVLRSLADCQIEVADNQRVAGLQSTASGIIKLLWESKDTKPDADTYALYLNCLDGLDGHSVAYKAEAIVQKMEKGEITEGFTPPRPNANVYNALLRIFVQWVGKKSETERILSKFTPNHETYWILLTSPAFQQISDANESLDINNEDTLEYIKKIRETGIDEGRTVREVDLLNAPIRWCGGVKPKCGYTPWTDYSKVFSKGLVEYIEGKKCIQKAKAVEEWVESSDNADLISYEGVIQAWISTATLEGLQRAEVVANKLLEEPIDSPRYPRLATFHPILFAWLRSNEKRNEYHLIEWTDKIFAAAKVSDKIVPDARIYELAILARVFLVKKVDFSQKLELANECSDLLEKFCATALESYTQGKGPIFLSIWQPFVYTIHAWFSCFKRLDIEPEMLGKLLVATERVTDLYERVCKDVYDYDMETRLYRHGRLSKTMRDIIDNAQKIYVQNCVVMGLMSSWIESPQSRDVLSAMLLRMEGSTQKLGEYNHLMGRHLECEESMEKIPPKHNENVYADHFDYEIDFLHRVVREAETRPSFLWKTAWVLDKIADEESLPVGDLVRLCRLLSQTSQQWRFRTKKFEENLVSILDKSLPGLPGLDSTISQAATEEGEQQQEKDATAESRLSKKKKVNGAYQNTFRRRRPGLTMGRVDAQKETKPNAATAKNRKWWAPDFEKETP